MAAPLMIAAAVVSAVGSVAQGQAAKNAANYNAAVADNNATATEQQAQVSAFMQSRRASMTQGEALAGFGANGVQTDSGSPLDLLAQSAAAAESDRQNIVYNGRVQAGSYRAQAALDRAQGKAAAMNGYLSAAGSLLSGGSKAFSMTSTPGSSLSTSSGSIPFNPSKSAAYYGD